VERVPDSPTPTDKEGDTPKFSFTSLDLSKKHHYFAAKLAILFNSPAFFTGTFKGEAK